MKRILQNIVRRLYWKLKCNQIENWATELILHCWPSSWKSEDPRKKLYEVVLAQIEEQANGISFKPLRFLSRNGIVEELGEIDIRRGAQ